MAANEIDAASSARNVLKVLTTTPREDAEVVYQGKVAGVQQKDLNAGRNAGTGNWGQTGLSPVSARGIGERPVCPHIRPVPTFVPTFVCPHIPCRSCFLWPELLAERNQREVGTRSVN